MHVVPGRAVPPTTPRQSGPEAACTVKLALVAAERLSPDVRVAVMVAEPAAESVMPETITDELPALMELVVVPPITPPPVLLSVKPVAATTLFKLPPASFACTVTLKPVPAVGEEGVTFVIANVMG